MKLTDRKGKLFGKINVVDFIVVVIVIVLLGGAYYKFGVLNKATTGTALQPVTYTVEVKRVRDYVFQNVQEGDEIFDKTSGKSIGKIVKVESTPATEPVLCQDGTYKIGTVQNRVDVIFTIMGEGAVTEDGCFINRTYELVTESDRTFVTKYFECQGKIKDFLV